MRVRCPRKHVAWLAAGLAASIVAGILLVTYALCDLAPFGSYSLAYWDAEIQYLDFFAYFKDVLEGKNSIGYTSSSYLGGSTFGLYAYYLASPFSFLVMLFPKEQMPSCFDVIALFKFTLCSATMAYYLAARFRVSNWVRFPLCVALAVGYALCSWTVYQVSNIMWLDAAYLLPVVFLGLWRGVTQGRWYVFSISIGLSLVFGWYAGAMNCLFSIFWFAFEVALAWPNLDGFGKRKLKRCGEMVLGYVASGLVGIMLAAVLLLPMLENMAGSSRGSLEFGRLKYFAFVKQVPGFVQSYTLGSSASSSVYAGMLVLIGLMGVFCTVRSHRRRKVIIAFGIVVLLFMLCWGPFFGLFSLLKEVSSYHIRYSYLIIGALVVFSGFYLLDPFSGFLRIGDAPRLALTAAVFLFVQMLLNYAVPANATGHLLPTMLFEGLLLVAITLGTRKGRRLLCSLLLATVALVDAGMNAKIAFETMRIANVEEYAFYVAQNEGSIEALKEREDSDAFRVSAIKTRGGGANQNESLAFDYASISGYSSVAPPDQIELLANLGYPSYGARMTVVPEAILPTDALLGVKYLVSEAAIPGLSAENIVMEQQLSADPDDDSTISFYENPYVFPLAFTTGSNAVLSTPKEAHNLFEYTDQFIETTLSVKDGVYDELDYDVEVIGEDASAKAIYRFTVPDDVQVVYGMVGSVCAGASTVELTDGTSFNCGKWGSRDVFAVHVDANTHEAVVVVHGDVTAEQLARFYAVDMEKFQEAARVASERAAVVDEFRDGYVRLNVEAGKGKRLFLSIPNDSRWHALVNGREASIDTVVGCLMMVPLDGGMNEVELRYNVVSYVPGAAISLLAVAILVGHSAYCRKRKSTR